MHVNPIYVPVTALIILLNLTACQKNATSFNPTNAVDSSYVHVSSTKLKDTLGHELKLKGVSLGGWLMWEAWEWGGGLNSETWIMNTIAGRTSAAFAQTFRESFYQKFITRDDIRSMHELGFNSVRVPFNHAFFDNGSNSAALSESHFKLIDNLLSWCEEFHVYVILDMHAAPGGQNPLFISDPDDVKVWNSDENKAGMVRIWKAIAERYKNRKIILGYDILNEPVPPSGTDLINLYTSVIAAIRQIDSHHLLILEGSNYAKDFSMFNTVMDNNQIYSFHFYPWLMSEADQLQHLQDFSAFADKVHAPLWCGEWGEAAPPDLQKIKSKLSNTMYNFCGDSYWTWKKVKLNANSYPLNNIIVTDQWTRMINNQLKLSFDSYEQIANSFLDAVLFANTVQDATLANAIH